MRESENKVLRRGDREVTERREELRDQEIYKLYSSIDIGSVIESGRMRWAGHLMEEVRNSCKILVGKSEGKRLSERPRQRWDDELKWTVEK